MFLMQARSKQNGHNFVDNILKYIFLKENCSNGSIGSNNSTFVQVMGWHLRGAKPLPESMLIKLSDVIQL